MYPDCAEVVAEVCLGCGQVWLACSRTVAGLVLVWGEALCGVLRWCHCAWVGLGAWCCAEWRCGLVGWFWAAWHDCVLAVWVVVFAALVWHVVSSLAVCRCSHLWGAQVVPLCQGWFRSLVLCRMEMWFGCLVCMLCLVGFGLLCSC